MLAAEGDGFFCLCFRGGQLASFLPTRFSPWFPPSFTTSSPFLPDAHLAPERMH